MAWSWARPGQNYANWLISLARARIREDGAPPRFTKALWYDWFKVQNSRFLCLLICMRFSYWFWPYHVTEHGVGQNGKIPSPSSYKQLQNLQLGIWQELVKEDWSGSPPLQERKTSDCSLKLTFRVCNFDDLCIAIVRTYALLISEY